VRGRLLHAVACLAIASVCGCSPVPAGVGRVARSSAITSRFGLFADATVRKDEPTTAFGTSTRLTVGAHPTRISYVRLPGTSSLPTGSTVERAVLALSVRRGSGATLVVHRVTGPWTEANLTWDTRPAVGTSAASVGPAVGGSWIKVDITPLLRAAPRSLALTSRATSVTALASRESARPPRLVVRYVPGVTAPALRYLVGSGDVASEAAADGWTLLDTGPYRSIIDALPAGTQALVWVGDYDNASCAWQVSDATLTSEVKALAGDARVAGYFISDEPDPYACPDAPAEHAARSSLIHSLDPGKPTVIVVDSNSGQETLDQLALWKDASDVQGLDPYPCHVNQPCDFGWIDQVIAAADAAGLHYWGMVQAFSGEDWRWPTPAEESHMLGQWSASAWTGSMTFAWDWSGNTLASQPALLDVLRAFNATGPAT
jgi:hypothetical protein